MPAPDLQPGNRKPRGTLGFGGLPPAYDLALRWGLTLTVSVLAGFFAGRWLDSKLATTPLFIIIGIFWALAGSFYSLYLQVKKLQEKDENQGKKSVPSDSSGEIKRP